VFGFIFGFGVFFLVAECAWWLSDILYLAGSTFMLTEGVNLLSPILVKFFLDRIVGRGCLVSERGFVQQTLAFTWYICFMLPFYFISGMASSLVRFGMLLGICTCSVVRIDCTAFPASLLSYDVGYVSFMASVLLAHRNMNPVARAFIDCLDVEHKFDGRQVYRGGNCCSCCHNPLYNTGSPLWRCFKPGEVLDVTLRRDSQPCSDARKRWSLALTLVNNPQLIKHRRRAALRTTLQQSLESSVSRRLCEDALRISAIPDSPESPVRPFSPTESPSDPLPPAMIPDAEDPRPSISPEAAAGHIGDPASRGYFFFAKPDAEDLGPSISPDAQAGDIGDPASRGYFFFAKPDAEDLGPPISPDTQTGHIGDPASSRYVPFAAKPDAEDLGPPISADAQAGHIGDPSSRGYFFFAK